MKGERIGKETGLQLQHTQEENIAGVVSLVQAFSKSSASSLRRKTLILEPEEQKTKESTPISIHLWSLGPH